MNRFPSEIYSIGRSDFKVEIAAVGWLGKWLKFEGILRDLRPPVEWREFLEMIALSMVEEDEEAERRAKQE